VIRPKYVKLNKSLVYDLNINHHQLENLELLNNDFYKQSFKISLAQADDYVVLPILWKARTDYVRGYSLEKSSHHMNHEFVKHYQITLKASGQS
jgi:EAL domain-containing protein (putative c-di-GMP-specific phosphodiesterase class I)